MSGITVVPETGKAVSDAERWLWRQACSLISMLPEKQADALKVLEYARVLVLEGPPITPV